LEYWVIKPLLTPTIRLLSPLNQYVIKYILLSAPETSNVETFKGAVQLSGFVNSSADIDRAVEIARGVNGVKSVKNAMQLK
jgi:hypothetical protein